MRKVQLKSHIGEVYNYFTIIEDAGFKNTGRTRYRMVKCRCVCGAEKVVGLRAIVSGNTKSCGCKWGRKKYLEIQKTTKEYQHIRATWQGIMRRCFNSNSKDYKFYGGRGIGVHPDWVDGFINFYKWAIPNGYDKKLQIDRIDNDGDYSPDNCRWVTRKQNCRNKRCSIYITIDGVTKHIKEWAEITGIRYDTLRFRYNKGWGVENILIPSRREKK